MRRISRRLRAALLALHILTVGALAALAMQILDAADRVELVAEISATYSSTKSVPLSTASGGYDRTLKVRNFRSTKVGNFSRN